jgi:hypothetical protein
MIRTAIIKGFQNGTQGPADAAPTITVTRNDTQAVVQSGTATLHGSGAATVYTFDWTEPTAPVTGYTYAVAGTIDGAPVTRTVTNIAGTPTPTNPPGTVQMSGTVTDGNGNPIAETIIFQATDVSAAGQLTMGAIVQATSNSSGALSIQLLQNTSYRARGLNAAANPAWQLFTTGATDGPLPGFVVQES